MKSWERFRTKDLLFSCMYGNGIYQAVNGSVANPLENEWDKNRVSPLLRNVLTGEEYYIKYVSSHNRILKKYENYILHPVAGDFILWPKDIVDCKEKWAPGGLSVSRRYTDQIGHQVEAVQEFGMLFSNETYPQYISGEQRIRQIGDLSWKNPQVQMLVQQILKTIEKVNQTGYIYADFHLSRFFFGENHRLFLDFSNLIFPINGLWKERNGDFQDGEYPIEFADPVVYQKKEGIDLNSQNFNLACLLFFLCFGHYPYDGRLLTGYADDSLMSHYVKFRNYIKMPIFIFDPEDSQNELGSFWEEERVIRLWEDLPANLKHLFVTTLRRENAERKNRIENPTAGDWMKELQMLGWVCKMEG